MTPPVGQIKLQRTHITMPGPNNMSRRMCCINSKHSSFPLSKPLQMKPTHKLGMEPNHTLTTSQNGNLITSQNGNLTTSQNGNLTTSQNGNLTTSENGNLITSQELNLPTCQEWSTTHICEHSALQVWSCTTFNPRSRSTSTRLLFAPRPPPPTYLVSSAPNMASILRSFICIHGAGTPW